MTAVRPQRPRRRGPRLARMLLERCLGAPAAEAIVGDLEEEYGRGRSRAWYWMQAIGATTAWASRAVRGSGLAADARFALRRARLQPAFTTVVVVTLALGIGANAAMFSVIDGVLLSPLPYPDPEQLVVVSTELTGQDGNVVRASPPELLDMSRALSSLEAVGGIWYRPAALTDTADEPEDIDMAFVSAGLLTAVGVVPALGRLPQPTEDVAGAEPVIVLSDSLWRRRYGADPDIVGRRIRMDDEPHTVVGVMPAGFRVLLPPRVAAPSRVDAWVTFGGSYEAYGRDFRIFTIVGRLWAGATRLDANAELAALSATTRAGYSEYTETGYSLRAEPLDRSVTAAARPMLLLLSGAVGAVMLIVCANIANLYLVRAGEAKRELAVRRALGATTGRVLRAVAVDCAVVTAMGAATGVLVARLALETLPRFAPPDLPRLDAVALDLRVVGFAVALASLTALAFATASALELRRVDSGASLRPDTPSPAGPRRERLRGGLLVVEIGLSLVLLIGVGLLVRSFVHLGDVDLGYDPDDVITFEMSLVDSHFPYAEPHRIADFYRRVSERVAALPGVDAAGVTTYLPSKTMSMSRYAFETPSGPVPWGTRSADYRNVTPGWMEAMGARLLAGRFFAAADDLEQPPVAIVDDTLAEIAWPGRNPIGQRLRVEVYRNARLTPVWAEVVGVVRHMRHDPARAGAEQIFVPHAQSPMRTTVLTLRTGRDAASLAVAVGQIVRRLDGVQPVGVALPLTAYLDATLAPHRFAFALLLVLSSLALLLALIGTYGVISYSVSRRTREIGIRMAVGATPAEIVRAVVAGGLRLAVAGIVVGLIAAVGMTRFLVGLLYGVTPTDPATFATLAALMASVAALASWLPARRAARLDPTLALRRQ